MDEIRRLAAGAPGEEIHLLVEPWQGAAIRRISIRRGEVETPSTKSAMLPLGLGYIRLLRFGPKAAVEFEKALEALEAERLNALILDLRDNPGGRLEEAVRIVNLLVGERTEPIVTERGPTGTKEWYPSGDAKPFHPLFVLIDRGTTSAAEVVAGALQDYRRGVLIGQATYGKGAKQTAFRLPEALDDLLGGEGRLLLTTSYLYLPLGRSIQAEPTGTGPSGVAREGGVTPDIRCGEAEERPDERKLAEITRVQYSSAVGAYLRGCLPEIHSALAEGRSWEPSTGPDFDALLSSLSTNLSPQEVRRILRALARRHMEEERGRETIGSLDDDPALQRAVLEALKLLGRDPAEVPAYRSLPAEPGATNLRTNLRTEEKGRS
jgi:C-terminal peptidase prc